MSFISILGFNRDGYSLNGFNQHGYDRYGYDVKGYSIYGYNRNGYDVNGNPDRTGRYGDDGYDDFCLNRLGNCTIIYNSFFSALYTQN